MKLPPNVKMPSFKFQLMPLDKSDIKRPCSEKSEKKKKDCFSLVRCQFVSTHFMSDNLKAEYGY